MAIPRLTDADNPVVGVKYMRDRDMEEISEKYWVHRMYDPGWLECDVDEFMEAMFDEPIRYSICGHSWSPYDKEG